MSDKKLCEMFGTTLEEVESDVEKFENGDWEGFEFSKPIVGIPVVKEKMAMVSAPVPESRIMAMQRVAKKRGISRAEFIRQAIDRELLEEVF